MYFNGSCSGNGRFASVVPGVDVWPGVPDHQMTPGLAPQLFRGDVNAAGRRLVVDNLQKEEGERNVL